MLPVFLGAYTPSNALQCLSLALKHCTSVQSTKSKDLLGKGGAVILQIKGCFDLAQENGPCQAWSTRAGKSSAQAAWTQEVSWYLRLGIGDTALCIGGCRV